MKSYRLQEFGSLAHLQQVEEPMPKAGRGQVVVKVMATSLNYRDLAILHQTGTLSPLAGLIPLSDGAGEVIELGEKASLFNIGSRVAGSFFPYWIAGDITEEASRGAYGSRSDGWLTQYKVVDESALVAIPDYLSYEQAATLPCAAVTAWNSLMKPKPIRPGETVLVQGTGGVAVFALQLAKRMGARVIALTSSSQKAETLQALGADEVINYLDVPDWHVRVRELTAGKGVERIVEIGGPGTLQNSILSCAAGGEISLLGFVAQSSEPVDFMTLFKSAATIRSFSVGSREDFIQMNRAVELHQLKPVISRVFPFEQAKEAWAYFERRKQVGKVVIAHH